MNVDASGQSNPTIIPKHAPHFKPKPTNLRFYHEGLAAFVYVHTLDLARSDGRLSGTLDPEAENLAPVEVLVDEVEVTQNIAMIGNDKQELWEGDILSCLYKLPDTQTEVEMVGYIRYSFGRFEVRCPWNSKVFVLGINPTRKKVGNVYQNWDLIAQQMERDPG